MCVIFFSSLSTLSEKAKNIFISNTLLIYRKVFHSLLSDCSGISIPEAKHTMPVWTTSPGEVFPFRPAGQRPLHQGLLLDFVAGKIFYMDTQIYLCVLLLPQPVSEIIAVQGNYKINQGLSQLKTKPALSSSVRHGFVRLPVEAQ